MLLTRDAIFMHPRIRIELLSFAVLAGVGMWISRAPMLRAAQETPVAGAQVADSALQELITAEQRAELAKGADLVSMAYQDLAVARSRVGDYPGAITAFQKAMGTFAPAHPADAADAKKVIDRGHALPAIEAIVQEARNRQIVILNEAHHVARHRAFAQMLATQLRAIGFDYLACETFSDDTASLRRRGYVIASDGYYTREPLFADFIRQSLKLGFIPISYESDGSKTKDGAAEWDSINQRETDQAANLIARIFQVNPKARVFIYVGGWHLFKKEMSGSGPNAGRTTQWMAGRLKAKTGIDPLTIDQVEMTAPPAGSLNAAIVEQIFSSRDVKASAVVLRRLNEPGYLVLGPYAGDIEMQVFHRTTATVQGRPDWMSMEGYRMPHAIPAGLLRQHERRLLKAHFEHEDDAAVAVDQLMVLPNDPSPPVFMLPAGRFRFSFEK